MEWARRISSISRVRDKDLSPTECASEVDPQDARELGTDAWFRMGVPRDLFSGLLECGSRKLPTDHCGREFGRNP